MRKRSLTYLAAAALSLFTFAPGTSASSATGVGNVPQGTQTNTQYMNSFNNSVVTNVSATTQKTSCFTPEVPYAGSLASQGDAYSGETACGGAATTGEALGPYPTQAGSNPGYPASTPMLVKDHSESDIRVDPTNPSHIIGSSKWFVSAEGYNHLLGFYESFDGGKSWPVQGHVPGYEGWTDNTDPVGAFDTYGNYYEFNLPYQFYYNSDGSHNFNIGQPHEPNPAQAAEAVAVAVRPHGATSATQWISTHNGHPDFAATYDSVGREPDKQWIAIDTNPNSPYKNTIYLMWVVFDYFGAKPYYSTAHANPDGTHTDWTAPQSLPTVNNSSDDTYLLPHVAPDGTVYTTVTNFPAAHGFCCVNISVDYSKDGGQSFQGPLTVAQSVQPPGATYANTTFRSGIEDTFAVGTQPINSHYPLYVSWEDASAGLANVIMSASYDGGSTWSSPIQVNDNAGPADEFQPNLTVAPDGTVSNAFYDRRLACPTSGGPEAKGSGIALDTYNPNYSGSFPPYGAANYCINASIQFYSPTLAPYGHNTRLTQHTWDPQLNSPLAYGINNSTTFIGDYFGNTVAGTTDYTTFVSTYNYGANGSFRQQQVVATIPVP